jgi:predicted RNase H-like HicB family nuclease
MIIKYEIIIFWSNDDECFVAEMPELTDWLNIANEKGWTIPEPKGRLVFA